MTPHDLLLLLSLGFGALNAWQSKSIQNAILALKAELIDRIGKSEGDIKALEARRDR